MLSVYITLKKVCQVILLTASYILGYLVIHDGPCSMLFINSPYQWTPLQFAACEDRVDTVRCLVDKGADLNIKDKFGVSEWSYT